MYWTLKQVIKQKFSKCKWNENNQYHFTQTYLFCENWVKKFAWVKNGLSLYNNAFSFLFEGYLFVVLYILQKNLWTTKQQIISKSLNNLLISKIF